MEVQALSHQAGKKDGKKRLRKRWVFMSDGALL
jgi:hypothetical protein